MTLVVGSRGTRPLATALGHWRVPIAPHRGHNRAMRSERQRHERRACALRFAAMQKATWPNSVVWTSLDSFYVVCIKKKNTVASQVTLDVLLRLRFCFCFSVVYFVLLFLVFELTNYVKC